LVPLWFANDDENAQLDLLWMPLLLLRGRLGAGMSES